MMENRVVCSSNLFASLDRREALHAIRGLGFRHVDLWASPLICGHVQPLHDDSESLRDELANADLTATSMTVFLSTDQERAAALELAAGIGADYVVVEPAPAVDWAEVMTNLRAPGRLIAEPGGSLRTFIEMIREYSEKAQSYDLKVCVEVPHVATVISSGGELSEFLWDSRADGLGLTFAPPHLALNDEPLIDTLHACSARIDMFYVWNVKAGYNGPRDGRDYGTGEEQLSPDGALPLMAAVSFLLQDDRQRDFVISAHGTEDNPDRQDVERMVQRAITQLPPELDHAFDR